MIFHPKTLIFHDFPQSSATLIGPSHIPPEKASLTMIFHHHQPWILGFIPDFPPTNPALSATPPAPPWGPSPWLPWPRRWAPVPRRPRPRLWSKRRWEATGPDRCLSGTVRSADEDPKYEKVLIRCRYEYIFIVKDIYIYILYLYVSCCIYLCVTNIFKGKVYVWYANHCRCK